MLLRREFAMRTGSEIMRLTYKPKAELRSMDTLRASEHVIKEEVALAKHVQEHMLRNYARSIQHTLVREEALKHKQIKGSPT
eukprot:4966159-Heterocapsa_arctica.AAC.1